MSSKEFSLSSTNLGNIKGTTDFSSDPDSNLLIASFDQQQSALIDLQSKQTQFISLGSNISNSEASLQNNQTLTKSYLNSAIRFSPQYSSQKMYISHTGLILSCLSNDTEEYAISNKGLNKGIHYFEFFCPYKCDGIQLGIISSQFLDKNLTINQCAKEILVFKTGTPRVIGLLFDFDCKRILTFQNGNFQPKKQKLIPAQKNLSDSWHLFVKIKESGNIVVFNPFATDPSHYLSQYKFENFSFPTIVKQNNQSEIIGNLLNKLNQNLSQQQQQLQQQKFILDQSQGQHSLQSIFLQNKNVILVQGNNLKLLRQNDSKQLNANFSACFSNKPRTLQDKIQLSFKKSDIQLLIHNINWNQILNNYLQQQQLIEFLANLEQSFSSHQNQQNDTLTVQIQYHLAYFIVSALISYIQSHIEQHLTDLKINIESNKLLKEINTAKVQDLSVLSNDIQHPPLFETLQQQNTLSSKKDSDQEITLASLFAFNTNEPQQLKDLKDALQLDLTVSKTIVEVSPQLEDEPQQLKDLKDALQLDLTVSVQQEQQLQEQQQEQQVQEQINIDVYQFFKSNKTQLSQEQSYYILSLVLSLEDQLYAMTLSNEAQPDLQNLFQNQKSRIHTSFGRLSSLLSYSNSKYSLVELSQAGVFNKNDLQKDLRFFEFPQILLENFETTQNNLPLIQNLQSQLSYSRYLSGKAVGNVSLEETINNIPYLSHNYISSEAQQPHQNLFILRGISDCSYISTFAKDGSCNIWNTDIALIRVLAFNFKQQFQKPDDKTLRGQLLQNKKMILNNFSKEPTFFKMFLDSLSKETLLSKKPQELEIPDILQPDLQIVENIYGMGFPLDFCKKAAVETKNEGVQQALDWLLQNQGKIKPDQSVKVGIDKIKEFWNCNICTYLNQEPNTVCDMCQSPAPIGAFYTAQEIQQIENEENKNNERIQLQKEQEEQRERDKLQKARDQEFQQAQEQIKQRQEFLSKSEVQTGFLLNLQKSFFSPLVLGMCFNRPDTQNSLIRIRRLAINPRYLQNFYKPTNNGFINCLHNEWVPNHSMTSLEHSLMSDSNSRLIISSLESTFVGNNRYSNPSDYQEDIFNQEWIQLEQQDFHIDNFQILAACCSRNTVASANLDDHREINNVVLLLKSKQNTYSLQILAITAESADPYNGKENLSISNSKTIQLQISENEIHNIQLFASEFAAYLITQSEIKIINIQNENLETIKLAGKKISAKCNGHSIQILDDLSNISTIQLNQQNNNHSSQQKNIQQQQQQKQQLEQQNIINQNQIDPTNLNQNEINSLQYLLQTQFLGCKPIDYQHNLLRSCNLDVAQNLNSKHIFQIKNQQENVLQLEFTEPTTILSIEIDAQFEHLVDFQNEENKQEDLLDLPEIQIQITNKDLDQFKSGGEQAQQQSTSISQSPQISKKSDQNDLENQYIPLLVTYYEGAQSNSDQQISKILIPNESSFITVYPQTCFVFRNLHDKQILIDKITIHSSFNPTNVGMPIGEGLIFTVPNLSYLEQIKQLFSGMQYSQYQNYKASRSTKQNLEYYEPVGAFQFEEKQDIITFELDNKRPARYFILLPTNFRSKPVNYTQHFGTTALELRFVGCIGEVLDETNFIAQNISKNPLTHFNLGQSLLDSVKLEVNVSENGQDKWLLLNDQDKNIFNTELIFRDSFYHQDSYKTDQEKLQFLLSIQNKFSLNIDSIIKYSTSYLKSNLIKGVKVTLDTQQLKNSTKSSNWELRTLGLQPFVVVTPKNISGTSPLNQRLAGLLRSYMVDIQHYDKFNKQFILQLVNSKISLDHRKAIMQLLIKLMNQDNRLIEKIQKDLDLKEFLKINLLRESSNSLNDIFSFIKLIKNSEIFSQQILNILIEFMPQISNHAEITPSGLQGFLTLLQLTYKINPGHAVKEILAELYKISKNIQKNKNPHYQILRNNYSINNLAFESEIFSDYYLSKSESNQQQSQFQSEQQQQQSAIKSRFICQKQEANRYYIVDLLGKFNIKQIFLIFSKNITNNAHFNVQIWSTTEQENNNKFSYTKKLIFSQHYYNHIFIQMANFAHENQQFQQLFKNQQKLECLGISNFDVQTRYLIIQITWSHIPHHPNLEELKQIPQMDIIPEVFGDLNHSYNTFIPELAQYFQSYEANQIKFTKDLTIGKSNSYEKFEVVDTMNLGTNTISLYDSKGLYRMSFDQTIIVPQEQEVQLQQQEALYQSPESLQKKQQPEQQQQQQQQSQNTNIQNLKEKLHNLQNELQQKLLDKNQVDEDQIQNLCKKIEQAQTQILKLRPVNTYQNDKNSLDFQYTLVMNYIKFLKKIQEQNLEITLESGVGSKYVQSLFETFIIFEEGEIKIEVMQLLNDWMIDMLAEKDWEVFIFSVLKKYLCDSQLFETQNYSHLKIIQSLDKISIPLGEVLGYLAVKLNIPVSNLILSQSQSPSKVKNQKISQYQQQQQQALQNQENNNSETLTSLGSLLVLLIQGYQKIPFQIFDPRKVIHKNVYCFNCMSHQPISGTRLKCANCPNLDCCSKIECQQKHLISFHNHTFLQIDEPLPLAPDKKIINPQPLLPIPFDLRLPYSIDHKIDCFKCGQKIFGTRYMCTNCEEVNVCEKCYLSKEHQQEHLQFKFHLFLKLDRALQEKEQKGTAVALIKLLDPLLYPLKTKTETAQQKLPTIQKKWSKGISREIEKIKEKENDQKDEEDKNQQKKNQNDNDDDEILPMPIMKRSISQPGTIQEKDNRSHPQKQATVKLQIIEEETEIELPRLDHEDSLKVAFQISVWISENQKFSDQEKIQMLLVSIDLNLEIMKLSSMNGLSELLRTNEQNLFKFMFNVLKLQNEYLIQKFQTLINSIISPKNSPPHLEENEFNQLQPNQKQKINLEIGALEDTRYTLIYQLQSVLQQVLDYVINPQNTHLYQQILKDQIDLQTWQYHVEFIISFLLEVIQNVQISHKNKPSSLKQKQKKQKQLEQSQQQQHPLKQPPANDNQDDQLSDDLLLNLPPGIQRSFSTRNQSQEIQIQAKTQQAQSLDKFVQKRESYLSIYTAINLIDLIQSEQSPSQRKGYNFQQSVSIWKLVLKIILKVKPHYIIESNIYESLVQAFLKASSQIQQSLLQNFLDFTSNLIIAVKKQQTKLSTVLITNIFSMLKTIMSTLNPEELVQCIQYSLIKGWIDILIDKTSPRSEDVQNNLQSTKVYAKFSTDGTEILLKEFFSFLINNVNLGGKEGAQIASEITVIKLEIAHDLINIIVNATAIDGSGAVSEYFKTLNNYQSIENQVLQSLTWFILNRNLEKACKSPSTEYLKEITDNMIKYYQILSEQQEISKICLSVLISALKQTDVTLLQLYKKQQLSCNSVFQFTYKSCKVLEELFDLFVTNDQLAHHVAFEIKGFEYLLDRMGINQMLQQDSSQKQNNNQQQQPQNQQIQLQISEQKPEKKADIFTHINQLTKNYLIKSSQASSSDKQQNSNLDNRFFLDLVQQSVDDLKEEEFASNVTIINLPGQHWSGISNDWSANKKGNKSRILYQQMQGQFRNECAILIQLEKEIEIQQLIIGFNTVWTEFNDKVLGVPQQIILEGGLDQNSLQTLGSLKYINDEGYSNFTTKIFAKNFQQINDKCEDFDKSFKSLQNRRVKFLKFIIKRPIVTFLENNSLLSGKLYKNIAFAISFLSVIGTSVQNLPNMNQNIVSMQQESALHVLGKLCNQNFLHTLQVAANNQDIVKKIQLSFETLSELLVTHERYLSPVILAIAAYNVKMGDWIIDNLLTLNKTFQHGKLITEIITADTHSSYARIQKLNQFILQQISLIHQLDDKAALTNLSKTASFIEAFSNSLKISSKDMITKSKIPELNFKIQPNLALQITEKDIEFIVGGIEKFLKSAINKYLIKYLITILHIQLPYQPLKNQYIFALERIWNLTIANAQYYEILAPLVIGSQEGINWILSEAQLPTKIDKIVGHLINKISLNDVNQKQNIEQNLQILNLLSKNFRIREHLQVQSWHVKIYNFFKITDPNDPKMIKDLDKSIISLVVDFLKNIILGNPEMEYSFAELLKNDITTMNNKRDMNFVQCLLVPMLNAEITFPVCLHPFDRFNNRWMIEGKKILLQSRKGRQEYEKIEEIRNQQENILKSNKNQLESLNNQLKAQQNQLVIESTILSDKQKKALLENINKFTQKTGNQAQVTLGKWKLIYKQEKENKDIIVGLKDNVLKKPPFLLLMSGTNGDKVDCVCGVFSTQPLSDTSPILDYQEEDYQAQFHPIKKAKDSFMFYYQNNFEMHFDIPDSTDYFGQFQNDEYSTSLGFKHGIDVKMQFGFSPSQSFVEIALEEMFPVDQNKTNFPQYLDSQFKWKKSEYFVFENQGKQLKNLDKQSQSNTQILSGLQNNLLFSTQYYDPNNFFNLFRPLPVYNLPTGLSYQQMLQLINISGLKLTQETLKNLTMQQKLDDSKLFKIQEDADLYKLYNQCQEIQDSNNILDLEFDAFELFDGAYMPEDSQLNQVKPTTKDAKEAKDGGKSSSSASTSQAANQGQYLSKMRMFEAFEQCGGVQAIMTNILSSISKWKNQERGLRWKQYLEELINFSSLPNFFSLFMKNREYVEQLFQLMAGVPDEEVQSTDKNKKSEWDEKETQAVQFSYKILSDVFRVGNDKSVREVAYKNGFFDMILNRIALITKEKKRVYQEELEQEEKQILQQLPVLAKQQSGTEKKIHQAKGVGYGGQTQTTWSITDWLEGKKSKSEAVEGLLKILQTFLDFQNWEPPKEFIDSLLGSVLLPLLENNLRGGGLLEMSKDSELILCYLSIIQVMAKQKSLVPLLLEIDPHWVPKQKENIYKLLTDLSETAKIFLKVATDIKQEKDQAVGPYELAHAIINCYTVVEQQCNALFEEEQDEQADENEMTRILSLPLALKYIELLKDLRFDYVSFKEDSKYKHHYASYIQNNSPPQAKLIRIAQELADMATALPIDHTNSIFVRADTERVDVMKALIFGSKGTPYGHGAFIYDVYFDDTYPNAPPKVNLSTTGYGKVRFNPNLYACGKVCLSLLGTWRGSAAENWDPKLSTYLQVLVSIQAIIMSEFIYFNEPGYEHEQGTVEGEKKNEAYSNIVRYCNVKFAMIDSIKNPPKGFETIIRRHFYLKKDEILEECRNWVRYAKTREANYTAGLITMHNSQWCTDFNAEKLRYHDMLLAAVDELEQILNGLQPPSFKEMKLSKQAKKRRIIKVKVLEQTDITSEQKQYDNIQMGYDQDTVQKDMTKDQEDFLNRMSRNIVAMGIDAVKKQSVCSIFLSGLGPIGVEITKNIVMASVKTFVIHDTKKVTYNDLSGQFFVGEKDIGKNRAEASLQKIKALNTYVIVKCDRLDAEIPLTEPEMISQFKFDQYDVIVLTEQNYATQIAVDNFCRKHNKKFIAVDVYGPFTRLFNDFGEKFIVEDKTGDDPVEVNISKISNEEKGLVTLLEGLKHPYEDNDLVLITSVEGMEKTNSSQEEESKEISNKQLYQEGKDNKTINYSIHKIITKTANSFYIGDTRGFTPYIRNGVARNIKTPLEIKFKSLEFCLNTKEVPLDQTMEIHDFMKMNHSKILHICFNTLDKFRSKFNRFPTVWDLVDMNEFLKLSEEDTKIIFEKPEEEKNLTGFIKRFSLTVGGQFPPLAAFMGGYASQELIKAMTNKYIPTNQFVYSDVLEVLPELPSEEKDWEEFIKTLDYKPKNHRTDGVKMVLGGQLLDKIQHSNIFMVGCGAIGCELLKNFAMVCLGTGEGDKETNKKSGQILITDPDHIENSNLSRQFLFREKHLRQPKSMTARLAIIQMNPLLDKHIIARLDKICEQTNHIYNDKFFDSLTLVTNALDSIPARKFVDLKCVKARIPLLESGTLGPKGHVQVIIPFKTESYGSQADPQEDGEIPFCTLKMFPEETLHCVEWARDKFGKMFSQKPKLLFKLLQEQNFQPSDINDIKSLRESVKLLKNRPSNFEDCIKFAAFKFFKYYRNDILQLLHTYPPDFKTKDGEPFWKLPKKRPTAIQKIDPSDQFHKAFIGSVTFLRAKLFNIEVPEELKDLRNPKIQQQLAEMASSIQVPIFKPSDEKAKEIASQVSKTQEKENKEEETKQSELELLEEKKAQEEKKNQNESEQLYKEYIQLRSKLPSQYIETKDKKDLIFPEEFEKDDDKNGHIDFIFALANCRSSNYQLVPMDWMSVKGKAGRIVPALATTTAAISGLQVIELIKVLKNVKIEDMKNAFLNLAVPLLQLGEPGGPAKKKIREGLVVDLWDRWDVNQGKNITIQEFAEYLVQTYKLKPAQIFLGNQQLFNYKQCEEKPQKERDQILQTKMSELLEIDNDQEYADLTVIFTLLDGKEFLKDIPIVRLYFNKQEQQQQQQQQQEQ